MTMVRIAAAQYPLDQVTSLKALLEKLSAWVDDAARQGAQLAVFPEYGGAEAMAMFARDASADMLDATDKLQEQFAEIDAHLAGLAQEKQIYILGGSAPVRHADGAYRNVARFFAPSGAVGDQTKLISTPYERSDWRQKGGAGLTLFETAFGKIGVAICYDVEFPLVVRALVEAGADIILCPCCTETLAGHWRVRVGCQARALENQCVVVQSPLVGDAPWAPGLEENRGAAGFYIPPDSRTEPDGVLKAGEMNKPGWVVADVDLALLRRVRAEGDVRNHTHWPEQIAFPVDIVEF